MTAIPGPTASASLQTARWLARPIRFLEDNRRRYGDAFTVMFKGFKTPLVIVSHPSVLRALYGERGHLMPPGRQVTLKPLVGARSLLLLEGSEHLSRRKVMLPPFRGDRMRAYEPIMRDAAERELSAWPVGRAFPVHPSMQSITLDVILQAVFGVSDAGRRARLHQLLGDLLAATTSMSLQVQVLFGRMAPLEALQVQAREIDSLLLEEIAARRSSPGEDICSLLVQARFEDGEASSPPEPGRTSLSGESSSRREASGRVVAGMGDDEIRDQLMTLLMAGHETTATGLAWTLDLLVRHPDVFERARDGSETYLKAVVSESLRLRPVVPLAGRRLAVPLEVDGLSLPVGTDVTPAMWLTHTRPEEYPEPYAFRPERFLENPPSTYT